MTAASRSRPTVLVTGGSSGLGAAVVAAVAACRRPPARAGPAAARRRGALDRVRPGRHPGRRGRHPAARRAGRRAGRGGHRRRHGRAGSPRRRAGRDLGPDRRRRPARHRRGDPGRAALPADVRGAASSPSPPPWASRRSATPPRTARRSSAWSASPGRSPPSWPAQVGVTLLIPGGMRTAFFDERDPQYKPGPDADPQRPRRHRRRHHVRAQPAARLRGPRAGGLRRAGDVVPVILVLRALGVGDLVTAVPALRALRAAYPGRELVLAAPAWLAPLVDLVGGVDRLVDTAGLDRPARAGPAPAGRGQPARARPAVAPAAGRRRPGRLLAFANPDGRPPRRPARGSTTSTRWTGGAGCCPGTASRPTATDLDLRRPAPAGLPTGVTVLHPGSKVPAKRWPAERFAALARALTERGHRVLLTGSADERALAARVADGGRPAAATRCWPAGPTSARWPRWSPTPGWWSAGTPASRTWPPRYGTAVGGAVRAGAAGALGSAAGPAPAPGALGRRRGIGPGGTG